MLLTAGYELVRELSRRYEAKVQRDIDDMPSKYFIPHSSCRVCLASLSPLTVSTLVSTSFEIFWLNGMRFHKDDQEGSSLLASGRSAADAYAKSKTIKAALYALQVFYSFFIM